MDSQLTELQKAIVDAFFQRTAAFRLTGGGALAGFYLGHRKTYDLDLFTDTDVLEEGERALLEIATQLGASLERVQTSPDFRRRLLKTATESVVVDLVLERGATSRLPEVVLGVVRLDSPLEILANKLCTLLSRAEIRDLVDVQALEGAGHCIEDALPLARSKDAGLTPAQLAWVLTQVRIGDDARIPGAVSPAALRTFLQELVARLTRMALPTSVA